MFGRWLRRRRMGLDLTQKALARRVGCSPATIRKLEAVERRPSRGIAKALAGALGVADEEHDAFIRFARNGWADQPPASAHSDLERPWLAQHASAKPGLEASGVFEPLEAVGAPSGGLFSEEASVVLEAPRVLAREAELGRLERELGLALEGHGRTVLIAGEAGQGETALMTAFAGRAQAVHAELLVAVGAGNAYTGRGDPFLPFRQILAQLTGDVPTGPQLDAHERQRAARLTRFMPQTARAVLERGPHLLDTLLSVQPLRMRLQRSGVTLPHLPGVASPAQTRMGPLSSRVPASRLCAPKRPQPSQPSPIRPRCCSWWTTCIGSTTARPSSCSISPGPHRAIPCCCSVRTPG